MHLRNSPTHPVLYVEEWLRQGEQHPQLPAVNQLLRAALQSKEEQGRCHHSLGPEKFGESNCSLVQWVRAARLPGVPPLHAGRHAQRIEQGEEKA